MARGRQHWRERPLLGGALNSIDTDTLKFLLDTTHNAAFIEEYRRRNCVTRCDARPPPRCACWACKRYGLRSYWDFCCHPDGHYPKHYLPDGNCHCWVCYMAKSDPPSPCDL